MRSIQKENDLNVKEKIEMNLNASPSVCFIVKACLVYGGIAFAFSMLGLVLPDAFLVGNPLYIAPPHPNML